MSRNAFHISQLIEKHLRGEINAAEYAELQQWIGASPENADLLAEFIDSSSLGRELREMAQFDPANGLRKFHSRQRLRIRRAQKGAWWLAAAVLLLVAAIGGWMLLSQPDARQLPSPSATADVLPGSNKAVLTLEDGKELELDESGNQQIRQGGAAVIQQGGSLQYPTQTSGNINRYNKLSTPRGGQFNLQLPDGTQVWLNAASSIRYPLSFSGRERTVQITGEVYFEVAANAAMPFRVKVADAAEITVLGTRFNVNAYTDEPEIRTALLSGSIRITRGKEEENAGNRFSNAVILRPGQQANISSSAIKIAEDADVQQAIAWKNGLFNFQGQKLEEVMRQLSRWYDVEVVYPEGVPDIAFFGGMDRGLTLSSVLRFLEDSKVHFRIEHGNRLVVLP